MTQVVLATGNAHKLREVREILAEHDLRIEVLGAEAVTALADVVESGVSFAQNATLKALAVCAATGLPAIGDDSGLAVDVLGGAPGIFSARWAGSHGDDRANLELLLDQVADIPDRHRGAQFVCAAALALPDGSVHVEHGQLRGSLVRIPRGTEGFGYDPVVQPEGEARTVAELTPAEKHAISHRGRAFRALVPLLRELTALGP